MSRSCKANFVGYGVFKLPGFDVPESRGFYYDFTLLNRSIKFDGAPLMLLKKATVRRQ